jgi:hypothetical protein
MAWLVRLLFYVSSLAPAAWIVWHYDLVNRVDRRLKGEAEPAAELAQEPIADPAVMVDPVGPGPVERQPAEGKPAAPRIKRPEGSQVAVRQEAPRREAVRVSETPVVDQAPRRPQEQTAAARPIPAAIAKAAAEPVVAHTIDLDLSGRRQRFALKGAPADHYRVVSLEGCPARHEIDPENGRFGGRDAATIVIDARREVRLKVTIDAGARGPALFVEPLVSTDDGKEIPFILANMEKIRRRVVKQGNAAADELAAIEAEGSRLMAWLNAPGTKPLAEVGQAKARIVALEAARVRTAAAIKTLEADLAVAEALEKLARQLHARCKVGIAEAP